MADTESVTLTAAEREILRNYGWERLERAVEQILGDRLAEKEAEFMRLWKVHEQYIEDNVDLTEQVSQLTAELADQASQRPLDEHEGEQNGKKGGDHSERPRSTPEGPDRRGVHRGSGVLADPGLDSRRGGYVHGLTAGESQTPQAAAPVGPSRGCGEGSLSETDVASAPLPAVGPALATADDVIEGRARYADTPGGHADRKTRLAENPGAAR